MAVDDFSVDPFAILGVERDDDITIPEGSLTAEKFDQLMRILVTPVYDVKKISLCGNPLTQEEVGRLAIACHISDLEQIDLRQCKLGDESLPSIKAILLAPKVNELLLSYNQFSDTGVRQLLDIFRENQKIFHLRVSCNRIDDIRYTPPKLEEEFVKLSNERCKENNFPATRVWEKRIDIPVSLLPKRYQ